MQIFFASLVTIAITLLGVFFLLRYFFYQIKKDQLQFLNHISIRLGALNEAVTKVHGRIDQIFVMDPSSANEAMKAQEESVEFSEQNIMHVPKEIKFEVEGDGLNAPPEFAI